MLCFLAADILRIIFDGVHWACYFSLSKCLGFDKWKWFLKAATKKTPTLITQGGQLKFTMMLFALRNCPYFSAFDECGLRRQTYSKCFVYFHNISVFPKFVKGLLTWIWKSCFKGGKYFRLICKGKYSFLAQN